MEPLTRVRQIPLAVMLVMLVAVMADAQQRGPSRRVAATPPLIITELMYHPDDIGAEFLELRNPTGQPHDVSGYQLVGGITFVFPAGSLLPADAYVVLVSSVDEFTGRYPGVAVDGVYSGRLSNSGDTVTLLNGSSQQVWSVTYSDTEPWPVAADGHGYSLVIVGPGADAARPDAWRLSSWLGGSPGADDGVSFDLTEAMFDPDHVLQVDIEIAAADWHTLRNQGRNRVNLFTGDCLAEPFLRPFTYFAATVTVDGTVVEQAEARKKGFLGSLSRSKPSLKLRFDASVSNQHLSGLQQMTLNNAIQDPSYLAQCLAYQVFSAAGVPAPRCGWANVRVNGEGLGLYVHLESIKKPFLARHFQRTDGALYEGVLSDFRPEFLGTFEAKRSTMTADRSDLVAVLEALQVSDDRLVEALQELIDLDAFYTFWATEVLLGHWDGYTGNTNNFYLYRDPRSGRFSFIPWGADQVFSDEHPYGTSASTAGVFATSFLARRLFLNAQTRQRYVQRVGELLETVWHEQALLASVDRMSGLVSPFLNPGERVDFTRAVEGTRGFVGQRRAQLLRLLQPQPPQWTEQLREPFCFPLIGELSASFQTAWGTWNSGDRYHTGSGSFSATLRGTARQAANVTAVAGPDPALDGGDMAVVVVVARMPNGTYTDVYVETDASLLVPGVTLSIDEPPTEGLLFETGLAGSSGYSLSGLLGEGTIHLEEIDQTHQGTVSGTIEGLVYQPTF